MTRTAALQDRWAASLLDTYGTPPVALASGRGCTVVDVDGREYLDLVAGIAVSALGHAHPAVVDAVSRQVATLGHTSNLAVHEPGVVLAERLLGLAGLGEGARVFFCSSGAEAVEGALKVTRAHGRRLDPDGGRLGVVAADGSFHGRTLGALSITGNPAKRDPFLPLPGPVTFVPWGDVAALREAVAAPSTAALVLEPTRGEGGVVPAPPGWLAAARAACDDAGALLVLDEVQSGIGRTGAWFAFQDAGVEPDVVTLAKGLGGGLPIGAVLVGPRAAGLLGPGSHGTTFGGNPVCCAAALAVLDTLESSDLRGHVRRLGEHLEARLDALVDEVPHLVGHRGSGLWRGLVCDAPVAARVEAAARDAGVLVNAVQPDVVRLCPPLVVTAAELDRGVAVLRDAFAGLPGGVDTVAP